MNRFDRQDVLRILRLESRQLSSWERAGLIPSLPAGGQYSFDHLARLRSLREMKGKRLSARGIRAQAEAMQQMAGLHNALIETTAVRQGSRLAFRHGGALVEASTSQLMFDFAVGQNRSVTVVHPGRDTGAGERAEETLRLQQMFAHAVQLEERPATIDQAVEEYYAILELKPLHAPACINLGTIFYHRRDFAAAEAMYRRATEADPDYALAFFDLGNVLDEMQRLEEAIVAYRRAVAIVPNYADAHYNLALAYERREERRKALQHWMLYVRLDPTGPWAAHARGQARKILAMERLHLVVRGGQRVAAVG